MWVHALEVTLRAPFRSPSGRPARPAIGHTARCAEPGVVIQAGRVHPVEVEWLLERFPESSHRVGTDVVTQSVARLDAFEQKIATSPLGETEHRCHEGGRPRIPSRQAFRRAAPVRRGTPQHRMLRRAAWRPGERASVVTMGVILSATRLGARCRRCHRPTALATASLTMTATADQCLTSLMISTGKAPIPSG